MSENFGHPIMLVQKLKISLLMLSLIFQNVFWNETIHVKCYQSGQENRIYIFVSLYLVVFFSYVYFFLRCRMVGFNFAHELLCTTWVKTTEGLCQNKSILIILLSQTGLKNSTNFVQEKWHLTGGGDRYLRKSLTLPRTRKLSESNCSSVLSVWQP